MTNAASLDLALSDLERRIDCPTCDGDYRARFVCGDCSGTGEGSNERLRCSTCGGAGESACPCCAADADADEYDGYDADDWRREENAS